MEKPPKKITDPEVQAAFDAFEPSARRGLLALRRMIFEVAREDAAIGPLEETLKWGQPAYLTSHSKSGTTVRLGIPKSGGIAIYTHCQTSVMSDVRALFPKSLKFDGNRAVIFEDPADIPHDAVALLIRRALTYHLT
ncbi:protein of unknown function (DU1801) [Aliiroseovarius halocynthiae]|uniref:DUF1801 domain-containing protein n=1 Tax=Aliiroseovarius halocynthiae TaxID=985055 RepID=A0A545SZI8_9RHOB|nr:DUF1801 domain-containing protein [Aliiroseovarius halocynthiae]TQV70351.1 DUF1801 domain-containing protein [Aliiroseovarius halocynthiae]SMR81970.1 protein of unknown function (DU1801) [Aliiroseovarius halocynthiae]